MTIFIIIGILIAIIFVSYELYSSYKINKYFSSPEFRNLYQFYMTRDPNYSELNRKWCPNDYPCSRQVVLSAENKPIDYIIKYFFSDGANASKYINWLKEEKERVSKIRTIYDQLRINENKRWGEILNNAPSYIKRGRGEKRLFSYRKNITEPNYSYFLFHYTSPKGNSHCEFSYELYSEEQVDKLLIALERKYGKGGTPSPNTGGTPSNKWIQEERKKMNRIFSNGKTLRDYVLERDNYTCQVCGNSIAREPNLLLEVDHIVPVSKWGQSVPQNLQTLCWKCNRSKSNK